MHQLGSPRDIAQRKCNATWQILTRKCVHTNSKHYYEVDERNTIIC